MHCPSWLYPPPMPTGTLVSGALYSFVDPDNILNGFAACFWASVGFAATSALIDWLLRDNAAGLRCGACCTLVPELADKAAGGEVAGQGQGQGKAGGKGEAV